METQSTATNMNVKMPAEEVAANTKITIKSQSALIRYIMIEKQMRAGICTINANKLICFPSKNAFSLY